MTALSYTFGRGFALVESSPAGPRKLSIYVPGL
jgi:hypothetical protein